MEASNGAGESGADGEVLGGVVAVILPIFLDKRDHPGFVGRGGHGALMEPGPASTSRLHDVFTMLDFARIVMPSQLLDEKDVLTWKWNAV